MERFFSEVKPEFVESISDIDVDPLTGEVRYRVHWKNSWVKASQMQQCSALTEPFLCKMGLSRSSHDVDKENLRSEFKDFLASKRSVETAQMKIYDSTYKPREKNHNRTCSWNSTIEPKFQSPGESTQPLSDITVIREVKEECKTKNQDKKVSVHLQKIEPLSWYKDDDVLEQLRDFHVKHSSSPPKQEMKKAQRFLEEFLEHLKQNISLVRKFEFTGSSFEGLKNTEDGLEFDIMLKMDGKYLEVHQIENYDGYCNLRVKQGLLEGSYISFIDNRNFVSPSKVLSRFDGEVTQIINEMNDFFKSNKVENPKKRKKGPAICLEFTREERKSIWFNVDLVPSFEIEKDGQSYWYVAKPLEPKVSDIVATSWRRSTSIEEKRLLKTIDESNECRKKTVQIVKAICKRESNLSKLTSFHLKTILFHAVEQKVASNWGSNDYHFRVFDLLSFIEQYLEAKYLPQYFIPSMNTFNDFNSKTMDNMLNRIRRLRTNKVQFLKSIKSYDS